MQLEIRLLRVFPKIGAVLAEVLLMVPMVVVVNGRGGGCGSSCGDGSDYGDVIVKPSIYSKGVTCNQRRLDLQ